MKEIIENKKITNTLTAAFIILFILTILLNGFILTYANDQCMLVDKPCEYAFGANEIVNNELFITLSWIQNILAIFVSVLFAVKAIIEKNWIKLGLAIVAIVIVPAIWVNVFDLLNIKWGIIYTSGLVS